MEALCEANAKFSESLVFTSIALYRVLDTLGHCVEVGIYRHTARGLASVLTKRDDILRVRDIASEANDGTDGEFASNADM